MLLCISIAVGVLASCDVALGGGDDDAYIEELDVNKKGELIVIFSDGEEENFGVFSPDGEEDGIVEISVSSKGKMTVKMANGKTKTVGYTYTEENEDDDEVIESVEINEEGELIVTRADGSEENLGRVRDKDVLDGTCTEHIDANNDYKCDKCGALMQAQCAHYDDNGDSYCDKCGVLLYTFCVHQDSNGDGECDICGDSINIECYHIDFNHDEYCDRCGVPFSCEMHIDEDRSGRCDRCDRALKVEPCTHVDVDKNEICDNCGEYVPYYWWEDITYDQTSLIFQMTNSTNFGEMSSSCERFLSGEYSGNMNLDDLVADRNNNAYEVTRVTVSYTYYPDVSEYGWGKSADIMLNTIYSGSYGAPDIYCNFVHDLMLVSLKGGFANLYSTVRGEGELAGINYLDLESEGYMSEYMSSLTLSQYKMYVIASDYFIDIIRSFYVVPVNSSLFNSIADKVLYDKDCDGTVDINDFYADIYEGGWTYERLAQYAGAVYSDNGYSVGYEDIDDTLGFVLTPSAVHASGLIYTSTVSMIYKTWNEDRGAFDYCYPYENYEFYNLCSAISSLFDQMGVYYYSGNDYGMSSYAQVKYQFSENKLLFGGIIALGELEHGLYQQMKDGYGGGFDIAPVPVYNYGDPCLTAIGNMARAGAISTSTSKFAQCTAFLQYQSTNSTEILDEYYWYYMAYNVVGGTSGSYNMLAYIRSNVRTSLDMVYDDVIAQLYENDYAYSDRWSSLLSSSGYQMYGQHVYNNYYRETYHNEIQICILPILLKIHDHLLRMCLE